MYFYVPNHETGNETLPVEVRHLTATGFPGTHVVIGDITMLLSLRAHVYPQPFIGPSSNRKELYLHLFDP